jgi:hypothetical protein
MLDSPQQSAFESRVSTSQPVQSELRVRAADIDDAYDLPGRFSIPERTRAEQVAGSEKSICGSVFDSTEANAG